MGLYLYAAINKESLGGIDISYGRFFWLRNEIAKLTGFEYQYKEMTTLPNTYFDKTKPENRLNNSKFIPKYDSPLLLKHPDSTLLTKIELKHLIQFLTMSDVEGKLTRTQIKSLWNVLKNKESKNINVKMAFNDFKNVLHIAYEKKGYIRWE
jgi:hypothetical protein